MPLSGRLGRCLIHDSRDLASVGQHDLQIKALEVISIYLFDGSYTNKIRQLSKFSLNISIHSKSYASRWLFPDRFSINSETFAS